METVHSVLVTFDGESKCGKTTIINAVAEEAAYQASVIPGILVDEGSIGDSLSMDSRNQLATLQASLAFRNITAISAGDAFRAAALYTIFMGKSGHDVTAFSDDDIHAVRELLQEEGASEVLQNDSSVGLRVSSVAQLPGVQKLCSTLFCDSIMQAYHADDRSNLVIVDARDPIGHLRRNELLDESNPSVKPASIIPVYIDTPVAVAASRLPGERSHNYAVVAGRREADATRAELPVVRPSELIESFEDWLTQFSAPNKDSEVAVPYRLNNNEAVTLDDIQRFAGHIAAAAQDIAWSINR